MCNYEIRERAKNKGVYLWELAEKLGIYDSGLSRKLRRELSEKEKADYIAIIDEIAANKK